MSVVSSFQPWRGRRGGARHGLRAGVPVVAVLSVVAAACGGHSSSAAGPASSAASSSSTIVFGQTVPKSGPAALYGESTSGVLAYFDAVNAHGGVNGHRLKLISLDDQYSPPLALQDTRTLVYTDHVFAEVAVNGTETTNADLTVLDPNNVPVVGPQTGATIIAGVFRKNLYNVWPSYLTEGRMLGAAAQHMGLHKVGVLYQNDGFGKSLFQGVKDSGLTPALAISYDPSQSDFSPEALQFKQAGVDGVIILAIPGPTTDFLNALSAVSFSPVRIMSQVSAIPQQFSTAPREFPGSYIGAFIPPLHAGSNPQVAQFLAAMKIYQPGQPASVFAAWGWTEAQVAVAGLEAMKGAVTRANYEAALNSLTNLTTLGGTISYTPTDHSGIKNMFLVRAENGHRVPVS